MDGKVLMGHGGGGLMMKRLIDEVFANAYGNDVLAQGNDAACLEAPQAGQHIAFSTDTFVVSPLFFPGGDIGRLAVCGTVNDVATSGATPRYLSCGFVIEEGFPLGDLERVCASIAQTCAEAGVVVATGDTKVVNRGQCDGVFINTTGIGFVGAGRALGGQLCRPGDAVILSGTLGDHGIAIMACREQLAFSVQLESDVAPLNHLVGDVLATAADVRCFRDPTRGGLAATLNELAAQSGCDIEVDETAVPVKDGVRGACEMLGYDVMHVANEGKMACVVEASQADAVLQAMHANPYGADAAVIGTVGAKPDDRSPRVTARTALGTTRILDVPTGELLPRIC